MVYVTLFFASLLAATLLPGGSEALLLYDLSLDHVNIFLLFISATPGNTLGAFINYLLGKEGMHYLIQKGYAKEKYLYKAHTLFEKYGAVALLFSWTPILGDPITFVAGVAQYPRKKFLLYVLLAKGVRYAVVIGLYLQLP